MTDGPRWFGVAGAPVLHSRSPAIHQAVFGALGLPWRYTRIRAAGPASLRRVMAGVPLSGVNLTAPLKEQCRVLADDLEPAAAAVGAVNTLVAGPDGRWTGANTDGEGVLGALDAAGAVLPGARAVVLGAGGAARSAVAALQSRGCQVAVVNRSPGRAQSLAADLGGTARPWEDLPALLRGCPVVVSALPSEAATALRSDWLQPCSVVLDADYATGDLGRRAAARGCRVATGLDWLAWQAVGAARRFTGRDVPADVVRRALAQAPEALPRRLALVGFMGAGKSAVAGRVAAALGWDAVETDALLEARFGRPVARIFAEEGEEAFRDAEAAVLLDLAHRDRVVVSCGGGLPAHGDNGAVLRQRFAAAWLHVSLDAALARVGDDPGRPLLHGAPRARLQALLAARTDAYVACSRLVVDAEEGTAADVAEGIVDEARRAFAG